MKKGKDLLVFAAIAAAAYFVSHITGIGCPIKFLTGISCGGCGMTRAWLSVAALDIKGAFYYHRLYLFLPCTAAFTRQDGKSVNVFLRL